MKRRRLLKTVGGAGLVGLGAGTTVVSADGDVHPNACPICPDWECPDACIGCWGDPSLC